MKQFTVEEWRHEQIKGKIEGCIIGNERVESVRKYVNTVRNKGWISQQEFDRIVAEVKRDSVLPFLEHPWNQPERLQRFNAFVNPSK